MSSTIIRHASAVKAISIPVNNTVSPDNWDRLQAFNPATSQPQEKLYEIGRLAKMATAKELLEASLSMTQLEYGTIDSYLQLAGLSAEPGSGLTLANFSSAKTDFYLPGKDEYNGSVEQTLWAQKLSLDSVGIEMSANERITRSFELSGSFMKIAKDANKDLIFVSDVVASGESVDYEIDLSDPAPVVDPNNAGVYMLQVYRVSLLGVATELTSADYAYTHVGTTLSINTVTAGDNIRVWYTSGTYGTAGDPTSLNDADDFYIKADNVTVTLEDGTHDAIELSKLTSLSIQATLNRNDEGAIGDNEKLFNEVESYDVAISLGGFVKNASIQEALMTQAGESWGIIDYSLFSSVDIVVKIYQETAKTTFMIGYKVTGCEFTDDNTSFNANEFGDNPISMTSDNLLISEVVGNL